VDHRALRERGTFGVAGGIKNGAFWGHLTYIDHGTGMKVRGTAVTAYTVIDQTTRRIDGTAEINGVQGTYSVVVRDVGEPGRQDAGRPQQPGPPDWRRETWIASFPEYSHVFERLPDDLTRDAVRAAVAEALAAGSATAGFVAVMAWATARRATAHTAWAGCWVHDLSRAGGRVGCSLSEAAVPLEEPPCVGALPRRPRSGCRRATVKLKPAGCR